jgi:hypothetical protein
MPNNKKKQSGRVQQVIDAYQRVGEKTDPQGSYTGVPLEAKMLIDPADPSGTVLRRLTPEQKKRLEPVQDVDDL